MPSDSGYGLRPSLASNVTFAIAVLCLGPGCGPTYPVCDESGEGIGTWRTVDLPTYETSVGPHVLEGTYVATPGELLLAEDECADCTVAALDPEGSDWEETATTGSRLVRGGVARAGGDYVFVHSGVEDPGGSGARWLVTVTTSHLLDRTLGTWTELEAPELQTHTFGTMHWTGSEFLLFYGATMHSDIPVPEPDTTYTSYYDGLFFDPLTTEWRAIPAARDPAEHVDDVNPPHGQLAAVWTSRGLFTWGLTPDRSGTWGRIFDAENESWQDINLDDDPVPLLGHSLLSVGDAVFVHGGYLPGSEYTPQLRMWRYSLTDDSWSELDVPEFADPLRGAVVGERLAFIGTCSAGSLYDPESDSWQVLSAAGAPRDLGAPHGVESFLAVTNIYDVEADVATNEVFLLDLTP